MRTIHDVIREVSDIQRSLDALCGYDSGISSGLFPTGERSSPLRCSASTDWHLLAGTAPDHFMLQACDLHLPMAVKLMRENGFTPQIHEFDFDGACGKPGSFYVNEASMNVCLTMDDMLRLGLAYNIKSDIKSEEDERRCHCECPACNWLHLKGECSNAIDDVAGYTHMQYLKMMMSEGAEGIDFNDA